MVVGEVVTAVVTNCCRVTVVVGKVLLVVRGADCGARDWRCDDSVVVDEVVTLEVQPLVVGEVVVMKVTNCSS